jgi:hypothetical protein
MKKFLLFLMVTLASVLSLAQNLPPNPIGIVNYTTPGTYVNYNYSFTAPTTGVDYFGVAIRQDPGYWGIGNFSITAGSSSTNLLLNPNLQYGGTTNTQYGLQAPANWGIWYQSAAGAPPAAGMYYAPGQGWMGTYTGGLGVNTSTAGTWIDGAVGTFDGIYQGINVRAGTTYNFSFSLNGTQSSSNPSIEIGAYAGACASGSNIFTCTPAASSGFTAAATPAQTQGTGGAPIPPPPPSSGPVFTDLKFSRYQVADSQWNVSSCTQTNTCQIYSTNPGTAYRIPWTSGQWAWQPGQYIQFATTGNSTNPYEAKVYNSNGTLAGTLGTGHILSMGTDSNGHSLFFFVGNDNNTGQLFSTNYGFTGTAGYTWTGTLNPNTSQVDTFASSGSTTPLDAGQTAGGGSSAPTATGTSTTNDVSSSSSVGPTTTTTNSYTFNNQTYIVTGTSTPTTVTTTTTPRTTTTWSDGTTTSSTGSSSSTSSTTFDYSVTRPVAAPISPYITNNKNGVYITQSTAGSADKLTVNQSGHGNYATVELSGSNNNINLGQGYTFNTVGISTESINPSNYNVLGLKASGNTDGITASQVGLSNSAIINITGNSNTYTMNQTGNNNQAYSLISGNSNNASIIQTGNGNIASVNLYGDHNIANVSQTGNNHGTVLNLINAGGANNATVIQTGTGDPYSLQQTCTNPAGCSVTVIRNR